MTPEEKDIFAEVKSIPISTVTFSLTKEDIRRYREEITKFPLEREEIILHRLPDKLSNIVASRRLSTFIVDLVKDIELLFEVLTRKTLIPEFSKKMILFALNYFIEEEDEIPDQIDILGYIDDAIIIRWVVDEMFRNYPEIIPARK